MGVEMKVLLANKNGQALMEIVPVMIIFIFFISASITYFKNMRFLTIREEVARNLMFSRINNSGTLTTHPVARGGSGDRPQPFLSFANGPTPGVEAPAMNSLLIGRSVNCFSVFPQAGTPPEFVFNKIFGITDVLPSIRKTINTSAVIFRQAGGACP